MKYIVLVLVLGVAAKTLFPDFQISEEYAPVAVLVGLFVTVAPIAWDCVRYPNRNGRPSHDQA